MFRTLSRALLPNRFDQMLKRLVKKKGKRVLLFWNRGLGDIALGLYAMVHRIREFVPDAEITFLTRKNLVDGFQMLEGVKVVGADWQRSEKNPVDIDTSQYDLVIEKPDPTEWVRWQRGELVPKLQWEARYDALWKKFELPDGYTERDSKIGRCQGGAPILSQAKSASKPHPKDDASLGTPQLNLNKLSDADGLKSGGCPTPAEPILESRSVYTYIGVQVVAETQYGLWRNWPLEKWRELFERLAYVGNHKILLFGFGKEPEITGEHIIDLRGKTTLYELLSIIKNRCRHLVLPDSGILSMVYYLNTSFPIQVVSLWADPNHGILKQNVASPNPQLQHTPLIASERDLNRVSVHAVMECLVPSRPLQHCISYTEIEPQSTLSGVGAILLAGGQGTRAGLKGPKGILSVHGRSLFQWICEKLPEKNFPLAIMTSPLNHEATLSFFKEHHFFGREIFFFPQSLGTILNEKKRPIALGPDGNGSVYKAFVQSGLADQFASRGIELMMIVPIENALADPADATLIAHHRASGAEVTIKCVERKRADEAMGALIEREHRIEILEYLYLKSNETYKYNNTGMMAMDLAFMRKMALVDLPLHWVQKNIQGQSTWKGERFIFDALKYTRKVSAVCYPRELCYAPLKSLDQLSEIEALLERVI